MIEFSTEHEHEQTLELLNTIGYKKFKEYVQARRNILTSLLLDRPNSLASFVEREQAIGAINELSDLVDSFENTVTMYNRKDEY